MFFRFTEFDLPLILCFYFSNFDYHQDTSQRNNRILLLAFHISSYILNFPTKVVSNLKSMPMFDSLREAMNSYVKVLSTTTISFVNLCFLQFLYFLYSMPKSFVVFLLNLLNFILFSTCFNSKLIVHPMYVLVASTYF